MKNLFNETDTSEIINRLGNLKPNSQRFWGKMEVAQMLTHSRKALEMATGENNLPRALIGRLIGRFFIKDFANEKPFGKNGPTDKTLKITDQRDFEREKQKLIETIKKFQNGGENECSRHPHPFFGKVTPTEWSIGMYKHLDHHLRQFGA
tara:strand:+ start:92 stop:541 length:450 start_codon:yes stop_codon:yes gene_type:complete